MAEFAVVAAVASAGAAIVGAGAQVWQGVQQQEAAKQTAHTLENQGKADFATAQRAALEKDLETKYLLSAQRARAAASGGGAGTDAPTIVRMMTETVKRGELARENIMYSGESSQSRYNSSAAATREGGRLSFLGGLLGGAGTLLGGAGNSAKLMQQIPIG